MIIRELILKNFGRFRNRSIRLEEGINIIYGENESGKSTLTRLSRACYSASEK